MMANMNITISDFALYKLNLYIRYVGVSRSACIAYFLSKQVIRFKDDKDDFMKEWRIRRYKQMKTVNNIDGQGQHYKRFTINISEELYGELANIQNELDVSMPKLTTNMIIMELNNVIETRDKRFSYRHKYIKMKEIKYRISDVFLMRIDNIAEKIGIPRNALISQIITEYLMKNYGKFDCGVYIDDDGYYHDGIW